MKKLFLMLAMGLLLASCNPSPQEYFDVAALNCNNFSRFGSAEMKDYLQTKIQIYDYDTKQYRMANTFVECFKSRFTGVAEANYGKVKDLPLNDETGPMIRASLELYDFVMAKYKNEYLKIAGMKDKGADPAAIAQAMAAFDQQYLPGFSAMYEKAWKEGLAYAGKHDIKVMQVGMRQ